MERLGALDGCGVVPSCEFSQNLSPLVYDFYVSIVRLSARNFISEVKGLRWALDSDTEWSIINKEVERRDQRNKKNKSERFDEHLNYRMIRTNKNK